MNVLQSWHASQGDQVPVLLFETVQCDWVPKRWVLLIMYCRAGMHLKVIKHNMAMLFEKEQCDSSPKSAQASCS